MWTEFWAFLTPPPPFVDQHGFLANPPKKPCGVLKNFSNNFFSRFFSKFQWNFMSYVTYLLFITKIQNAIFQMKTPNSRNSTALSAAVYENFCPRGPALTPPPPLWTDMVFSGTLPPPFAVHMVYE